MEEQPAIEPMAKMTMSMMLWKNRKLKIKSVHRLVSLTLMLVLSAHKIDSLIDCFEELDVTLGVVTETWLASGESLDRETSPWEQVWA